MLNLESNTMNCSYLVFSFDIELEGVEQLVVDTHEYHQQYNSSTSNWQYVKKDPIKMMIKKLCYDLDDNQFSLDNIVAHGFRKDKKLRVRENWVREGNPQFLDIVSQIPDHFHDKARAKFAELITTTKNAVSTIERNGVKIK